MSKIKIVTEALKALNWKPGSPPGREFITKIDKEVARDCKCCQCKRKSLRFHPFHQRDRFMGVLACTRCSFVTEG